MRLSHITLQGFKSFAKKTTLDVTERVTGVVGPNGSGKSNIAEAIRFVLGEQSMKTMRGKVGTDVIFKGSGHLSAMSRAAVTMVIDNREKIDTTHISEGLAPYLVYDELVLSRVIYADGTSDYLLNDAKLRLKDVQELLSFAGIGSSAHTIINQGEADRILLASPKDRKEALEDALGLRVYHMRLNESKRKLEKVKVHVHEVDLLRKEIKPHLLHLERQVKKIEGEEEERKNLHALLVAYLTREDAELIQLDERIKEQGTSESLNKVVDSISKELAILSEKKYESTDATAQEKETLQTELRGLLSRKDQMTKSLGRLEAERSFLEKELTHTEEKKDIVISSDEFTDTHALVTHHFDLLGQSFVQRDIEKASTHAKNTSDTLELFFMKHGGGEAVTKKREQILKSIDQMVSDIQSHEDKEKTLKEEIHSAEDKLAALENTSKDEVMSRHEEEKKVLQLESKRRELESVIALRKQEEHELALRKGYFDTLLQEGVMIVGRVIVEYKQQTTEQKYRDMEKRDLLRAFERSKLKIEEASVPNREEVISEYKTTRDREEYLTNELADIEESEQKLLMLIRDLTESLEEKLTTGVQEVSRVFSDFFGEVFVGGKGHLSLIEISKLDEDGGQIFEQGVDIDVVLPNKKVRELTMFSGGERTLVSIALLFAMSSITPPPFMVLDETDAPLDEANARKYGMMLKRLAEKSKLLVITHNRETMNHCDMLYGVTIGADGGSKLLSINFKEAESYAK